MNYFNTITKCLRKIFKDPTRDKEEVFRITLAVLEYSLDLGRELPACWSDHSGQPQHFCIALKWLNVL